MAQIVCHLCSKPIVRLSDGQGWCSKCRVEADERAFTTESSAAAEKRARGAFVYQFVLNAASSGHIGDTGFVIRQAEHAWQQLREKYPFGE